jgi:uncharacterized protein
MNCIIIHGCPSDREKSLDPEKRTYDKHWIPWTKKKLEEKDIKTKAPLMPEPWYPDYEKFKKGFEKYDVDEDTVLVGHSCGCTFLVRWLSETKQKIDKLILVAPWKVPDDPAVKDYKFKKTFYDYQIDETIKDRVNKIVMFTADNEVEDGKKGLEMYHKALGGNVIEIKGYEHYCLGDMGGEEFPELIKEIISS